MHALAWFFPFFQGLLLGIIAMAFHEVGHLIAAPLVGIKIKTVGLRWKGSIQCGKPGRRTRTSSCRWPDRPSTSLCLHAGRCRISSA